MRPDKFTAVGLIARLALARISKSNSLVDGAPVRTYLFLIAVILNHVAAIAATTSYTCIFPVENSPKGLSRPATPFELRYLVKTCSTCSCSSVAQSGPVKSGFALLPHRCSC